MARFSLATYTIRITNEDGDKCLLDEICDGKDLLDVVKEYLSDLRMTFSDDVGEKKLLGVLRYQVRNRTLRGIIQTGEYGYESSLYDRNQKRVSYRRRVHEADMLPFYFLVYLPKKRDEGIMILQRFKQFGIRRVLVRDFDAYLHDVCDDANFRANPLVPRQYVKQILNEGRVTKIRFVNFEIPKDIADAYDKGGHIEKGGYVEYRVVARRDGWLPIGGRLRAFLNGKRGLTELIELENFDYNSVKVEMRHGNTRRTVDLANLQKLRALYDISDQIHLGDDGHPTFHSIDLAADGLLTELVAAMG